MRVHDVTAERVRDLAGHDPAGGKVLTLYLNLDPGRFATGPARRAEIRSLIHDAQHQVQRAEQDLPPEQQLALREALRRVEDALVPGDLPAGGAQGIAVFASAQADLLELLRTPRPVPSRVFVDDTPHLAPLLAIGVPEQWCVALVTRGGARYLLGPAAELHEALTDDFAEPVEIEGEDADRTPRSMRRVAATLADLERGRRFERLLLVVPDELRSELHQHLHAYVHRRLAGDLPVDAAHASVAQVIEATLEPEARRRPATLERRVGELREHAGRHDGRAVLGAPATLEALHERRVQTLLVADGFVVPGTSCPRCGRLAAERLHDRCPLDDEPLEVRADVVGHAVHAAVDQHAEVLDVRPREDLVHGIAALLRW